MTADVKYDCVIYVYASATIVALHSPHETIIGRAFSKHLDLTLLLHFAITQWNYSRRVCSSGNARWSYVFSDVLKLPDYWAQAQKLRSIVELCQYRGEKITLLQMFRAAMLTYLYYCVVLLKNIYYFFSS